MLQLGIPNGREDRLLSHTQQKTLKSKRWHRAFLLFHVCMHLLFIFWKCPHPLQPWGNENDEMRYMVAVCSISSGIDGGESFVVWDQGVLVKLSGLKESFSAPWKVIFSVVMRHLFFSFCYWAIEEGNRAEDQNPYVQHWCWCWIIIQSNPMKKAIRNFFLVSFCTWICFRQVKIIKLNS